MDNVFHFLIAFQEGVVLSSRQREHVLGVSPKFARAYGRRAGVEFSVLEGLPLGVSEHHERYVLPGTFFGPLGMPDQDQGSGFRWVLLYVSLGVNPVSFPYVSDDGVFRPGFRKTNSEAIVLTVRHIPLQAECRYLSSSRILSRIRRGRRQVLRQARRKRNASTDFASSVVCPYALTRANVGCSMG